MRMRLEDCIVTTIDNRGKNPKAYFTQEQYPVIDNVLIKNTFYPDMSAVTRYIDDETFQNFLRGYVHKDMPIMTLVGNGIGNVTLAPSDKCAIIQNTIGFLVNDKIDQVYLYYYLLTQQGRIKNFNRGSGQPSVRKTDILSMEIDIPEVETQHRIVSILRSIDEKIENNNKINDNLQQQAATIFAEWLSSCTGSASIGELSNNILDYSPVTNEMVRLLNSSDVTEGFFFNAPLVPNKDLKGHFKKRFQFDDILYSEIRPRNHHYGYVLFDASEYIASTRLMVIRAITNKVSPAILYQYLLLPEVEAEFTLKTESRSGTFPQGNYADMASIVVPYSSTEAQIEVSAILSQIRYTIALNQLENQRLEELCDTLLPKLISGEIDVSDIQL